MYNHDLGDPPPPLAPLTLDGIVPEGKIRLPGIYFGLSEDEYHGAFALSSSGIKLVRSSPLDFWVRSCLNPNLALVLEDEADTIAELYGRAFHKLALEGRDAFDAAFTVAPDKADHKDAVDTVAQLRPIIDQINQTLDKKDRIKKSGGKDDLIASVLLHRPHTKIWDAVVDAHAKIHEGKTFLKREMVHQVELAVAMIVRDPNLKDILTGGMPEVSVFWYCQHTGVPCKARFDYLKPAELIDAKTFYDGNMRPVDEAVDREINLRRYAAQVAWYLEAATYLAPLIRAGRVFGHVEKGFLDSLLKHKGKRFRLLLSRKGPAPVARARWLSSELGVLELAKAKNERAREIFAHYLTEYGADMWVDSQPTSDMTDDQFSDWAI